MTGHGEKLSRKQGQAIAALLTAASIPEAAEQVGVGERTLRRWLQDEVFQATYRDARRQVVQQGRPATEAEADAALARTILQHGIPHELRDLLD